MRKIAAILCCLLWMGFIFYQSSQSGETSNEISHEIINQISNQVKPSTLIEKGQVQEPKQGIENTPSFETLNVMIRKSAHAFEFFVLALLLAWVLTEYHFNSWKLASLTLIGVCLYAASDEFHQFFVEGRSARLFDVFVDSTGGIIGICLFIIVKNIKRNVFRTKIKVPNLLTKRSKKR